MIKDVVLEKEADVITVDEVTTGKGYMMKGDKGNFILAMDTDSNYIWVRLDPSKLVRPVHKYSTAKDAIADKLRQGFEVVEYTDAFVE